MGSQRIKNSDEGVQWTEEASRRLMNIPDFVRPMAKKGIENFAMEKGRGIIDDRVMDEVKEKYGM